MSHITTGRIAANIETTISASTIKPLWGDEPPVWLLHIRFAGLGDSPGATARDRVVAEAFASMERHGREQLPRDIFDRYAGRLFFVDERGCPLHSYAHDLRIPSSDMC